MCVFVILLFFINFLDEEYDDEGSMNTNPSGSPSSVDVSNAEDSEDDNSSDDGSFPLEPSSQTEMEEEPVMEEEMYSSEVEPENENITYGKRCVNFYK